MQHSHSEGSDLIGSNTADADEDADPSNEADDWSCWGTNGVVAAFSVVGVSGVLLVTSKIKHEWNKINHDYDTWTQHYNLVHDKYLCDKTVKYKLAIIRALSYLLTKLSGCLH